MQGRGLTPSVINDVIENGVVTPGNATGTFVNELNGVRAVTNQSGDVITTMPRTH